MKKLTVILCILFSIICANQVLSEEIVAGSTLVNRAVVCSAIEEREPAGIETKFSSAIGRVYFFNELKSSESGSIKHIWYFQDNKIEDIELDFTASNRYRTWSYVDIDPNKTGDWKVEAVINGSTILAEKVFTIE